MLNRYIGCDFNVNFTLFARTQVDADGFYIYRTSNCKKNNLTVRYELPDSMVPPGITKKEDLNKFACSIVSSGKNSRRKENKKKAAFIALNVMDKFLFFVSIKIFCIRFVRRDQTFFQ